MEIAKDDINELVFNELIMATLIESGYLRYFLKKKMIDDNSSVPFFLIGMLKRDVSSSIK